MELLEINQESNEKGKMDQVISQFSEISNSISWQRSLAGYSARGHKESDTTGHAHTYQTRRLVFFLLNHSRLLGGLAGVMKQIEEGKYKGMMKSVFISLGYILWSGIAGLW